MGADTATLVVPTFLDGRRIWVILFVLSKENFSSYAFFLWFLTEVLTSDDSSDEGSDDEWEDDDDWEDDDVDESISWGEKTRLDADLGWGVRGAWTDCEADVAVLAKKMDMGHEEGDSGETSYGIVAHPGYRGESGLFVDRSGGAPKLLLTAEQRGIIEECRGAYGFRELSAYDVKGDDDDDDGERLDDWSSRDFRPPFGMEQRLVDADGSALALRQMGARLTWGREGWLGGTMPTIFWSRQVHRAVIATCLGVDVSVRAFVVHFFVICNRVGLGGGLVDMVEMIMSFLMEVRVGREGSLVQQQQAVEYGEGGGGDDDNDSDGAGARGSIGSLDWTEEGEHPAQVQSRRRPPAPVPAEAHL